MQRVYHQCEDYIGRKVGKLTILSVVRENVKPNRTKKFFNCLCECGNNCKVQSSNIFSAHTKSCGCLLKERVANSAYKKRKLQNPEGEVGKIFGRLTVISFSGWKSDKYGRRRAFFDCQCSCGNKIDTPYHQLKSQSVLSCGCLDKETRRARALQNAKNNTLPNFASAKNELFSAYKSGAKHRHLTFDLTKEEFLNITSQDCYYCKSKPSSIQRDGKKNPESYIYNGIDRINNDLGYTLANSIPCCSFCNIAKHHNSQEYFLNRIKDIYNNFYGKP